MKIELEPQDIQAIAEKVVEMLKPHLTGSTEQEDAVFDKEGLAEYLHVDVSWINKQITQRAIPFRKLGKYTRFWKSSINDWFRSLEVKPSPYIKLLKR